MANTKITTRVLTDGAITSAKLADDAVSIAKLDVTDGTNGQVLKTDGNGTLTFTDQTADTNTTYSAGTGLNLSGTTFSSTITQYADSDVGTYLSSNGYATQSTVVAAITDSAPATLDTLNELAAALGDDANFSTTVTNSIALKAPLASPSLTGTVDISYGDYQNSGALRIGADIGTNTSRTNSTRKIGIISAPHYTNAEDDISLLMIDSEDNNCLLSIGGTASAMNSPSGIAFVTSSDAAGTSTGTERMRINNVGETTIKRAGSGGSGVLKALNLNHAGTSVNDGAKISFTAGTSTEGAGIASTGQALNSADLRFYAGGNTERMRIDSSGNVGIGTDSPAKLGLTGSSVGKVLNLGGDDCQIRLANSILHHDNSGNTTLHLRNHYGATSSSALLKLESGYMTFNTGTSFTERMRLNSNGTLIVGTTANPSFPHRIFATGNAITNGTVRFDDSDVSCGLANVIMNLSFSSDSDATSASFVYMTDGNGAIGSITAANGTSVNYNTTSDERLKKNIVDASSQLNTIKNIKIREFDWKRNDFHEVGVIAQELKTIVPNAVQEGGDDETKNPFGVDYGKIVPYLIKAMQEQQTIIDDLKSRIETLEG